MSNNITHSVIDLIQTTQKQLVNILVTNEEYKSSLNNLVDMNTLHTKLFVDQITNTFTSFNTKQ